MHGAPPREVHVSRGGDYSQGKRRREAEKARKRQEKADRRRANKEANRQRDGIPIVSAAEVQVGLDLDPESAGEVNVETIQLGAATKKRRRSGGSGPPVRLFVGNLSYDLDKEGLKEAFSAHGQVIDAAVVLDRDTGQSRGFGFVTMGSKQEAEKAMQELDGQEVGGRRIAVKPAVERQR